MPSVSVSQMSDATGGGFRNESRKAEQGATVRVYCLDIERGMPSPAFHF